MGVTRDGTGQERETAPFNRTGSDDMWPLCYIIGPPFQRLLSALATHQVRDVCRIAVIRLPQTEPPRLHEPDNSTRWINRTAAVVNVAGPRTGRDAFCDCRCESVRNRQHLA